MTKKYVVMLFWLGVFAMTVSASLGILSVPYVETNCKAVTMTDVFFTCKFGNFGPNLIRAATVIGLSFAIHKIIRDMMNFATDLQLREQQISIDGNDSPSWLNGLALLALVILVFRVPFTTPFNYLINLLWSGGVALILSIIFSFYTLRNRCSIKTIPQINELMKQPNNNAVAIWIGLSMVAAAFIA